MDLRPREERDLNEIYPELDSTGVLPVFVANDDDGEVNGWPRVATRDPIFRPVDTKAPPPIDGWEKFGYIGHNQRMEPSEVYHRPFVQPSKRRVGYDMDEQDEKFVEWCRSNDIEILAELLEVAMVFLDRQWDSLDKLLPHHPHPRFLTLESDEHKYGNDDGVAPGLEYDQRCAVCNESDCTPDNAIVFCDGCDIAVHQECYGIAFIPEGLWLCRKCMINRDRDVSCVFCPLRTGAFKQLDTSQWGHVMCGLWINEVYFANPTYMEPIEGMNQIPKLRWKLVCYLCKKRVGACIQCYNRLCVAAYHVTCARRAQLPMELTEGISGALVNKTLLKLYCHRHAPPGWHGDINKCRNYYRDLDILLKQNEQLTLRYQAASRLNQFKWKTVHNTPIAPEVFAHRLVLAVGCSVDLAYKLCKWWCLKRDAKRGRLTRPPSPPLDIGDAKFAGELVGELEKLAAIAHTNEEAAVVRGQINDIEWEQLMRVYYPEKMIGGASNDEMKTRTYPFVEVDGAEVSLKSYDYKQVLEEEGLLEVE